MSNKQSITCRGVFISIFIVYCLLFVGTNKVLAQEKPPAPTEYTLLAPLPLTDPGGAPDQKVVVSTYIQGLFKLIIAIAGGLAVIMLIYGGITYMSTDAFGKKESAKEIINNALWGFLLAISAWLILYTINPNLVNINLSIEPQPISTGGGGGGGSGGGGGGGGMTPIDPNARSLTDAEARAKLGSNVKIEGNITLNGIKEVVVDEILRIKSECGCDVVITSATGGSHASGACSHGNGYKVDLRKRAEGAALGKYIKENYSQIVDSSGNPVLRDKRDPMWKAPSGAIYTEEPSHWDVVAGCK